MKKRILALLMLLVFSFGGLTACVDSGNGNGNGNGNGGNGSDVTLKVWIQSANQPQLFTWIAQDYKSKTGVSINWIAQSSATLGKTLDASLAGAEAPDIAATWGGLIVPTLIKGKRILKIDDVITEEVEATLHDSAKINKGDSDDGSWYSVPLNGFASPVVFYNKTALGASFNKPTTYAELKAVTDSLPTGKQGIVSGFGDWQMSHFMQAMHARTMSADNFEGLIGVNTQKNPFANAAGNAPVAGLENGFALLKKYQTDKIFAGNITGYNVSTAQSYFMNGNALMYAAPSLEYLSLSNATFDIGAFVLPEASAELASDDANAPSSLVSGVYSDVFVVNAKTSHPAEAKAFMKYLLSTAVQEKLLEYFLFPSVKGITTDNMRPAYKAAFEAVLGDIYEAVNDVGCTPFYQSYSIGQMDGRLASLGQNVLNGTMTAKAAAEDLKSFYDTSGILD